MTETIKESPSEAEKKVIQAYQKALATRGFCLLDSIASSQTQLYNRFTATALPMSYIANDFSKWLRDSSQKCKFRTISYITYTLPHIVGNRFVPLAPKFYVEPRSGLQYANIYQQYAPTSASSNISPLLNEFFVRLVPCPKERHLFLQWLAHTFQRPNERPSWHILMSSQPGCGKGFLVESILTPLLLHTSVVNSYARVMGQFSMVMARNLLVLLDDPKSKSDDTQTKLKSLLSEERAYCEGKGVEGGMVDTFVRFILASNEERPLHLDASERRWFALTPLVHKESPTETQTFIQSLADWLALEGSLDATYNFFMQYDLTGFNHKHVAQSTALKDMIGMSKNPDVEFIASYIEDRPVFRYDELMAAFKGESRAIPSSRQMPHLLRELRYESTRPRIDGVLTSLCHPAGMPIDLIRSTYKAIEY